MFAGTLSELLLQLQPRLLQQAGNVLRAEKGEFRADRHQLQQVPGRQLVAEGILDRRVGIRRRPPRSRCTDRKTLAQPQVKDRILGNRHLAGLARLYLATLDHVEEADIARIRADNLAVGRVKDQLRLFREQLQGIALHLVKGRVMLEEFLGAPRDAAASLLP